MLSITKLLGFEERGGILRNNPVTGGYYYDIRCANVTGMPSLTLLIGGYKEYVIPAAQLVLGNGSDCISLLVGLPNVETWTLGGTAQLNKYITFDFDNNEIRIAQLIPTN
jgi:hypothetical protein